MELYTYGYSHVGYGLVIFFFFFFIQFNEVVLKKNYTFIANVIVNLNQLNSVLYRLKMTLFQNVNMESIQIIFLCSKIKNFKINYKRIIKLKIVI